MVSDVSGSKDKYCHMVQDTGVPDMYEWNIQYIQMMWVQQHRAYRVSYVLEQNQSKQRSKPENPNKTEKTHTANEKLRKNKVLMFLSFFLAKINFPCRSQGLNPNGLNTAVTINLLYCPKDTPGFWASQTGMDWTMEHMEHP